MYKKLHTYILLHMSYVLHRLSCLVINTICIDIKMYIFVSKRVKYQKRNYEGEFMF